MVNDGMEVEPRLAVEDQLRKRAGQRDGLDELTAIFPLVILSTGRPHPGALP